METIPVPDAVTYEAPFVAETYLEGAYEDWYEDEGYADYVSVEGLVVEGEYLPFVIHDKTLKSVLQKRLISLRRS